MTKYEFTVAMTCNGCKNAVNSVLTKTSGVTSVDIDVPTQKVVVESSTDAQTLLDAIKKTGKKVELKSQN